MTNQEFLESITLEGEEWRIIEGTLGYFAISNLGRVASLSRFVRSSSGSLYPTTPNVLTSRSMKNGYVVARLTSLNGVDTTKLVHRLVATHFIPNPNNYPCVDHIDGNKQNNRVENLRWCTRSMNMLNPITRKRNSAARTGKTPNNTKAVVQLKDGEKIEVYSSISKAAQALGGLSLGTLCDCCKNQSHTYKGFNWMYLSDYENLSSTISKNS